MEDLTEFLDLEEYALKDKKPPKKAKYLIRVDKKK